MPERIQVRAYRLGDRRAVCRVLTEARRETFPGAAWPDADELDLEGLTLEEEMLVAERREQVVGMVALYHPMAFIHHLYVLPSEQRRGVGKALLRAALALTGGHGALKCQESNIRARHFYRAQGWVEAPGETDEIGPWLWCRIGRPPV